jgi:carbon-monoxide dehydrogenase catalytic subunit
MKVASATTSRNCLWRGRVWNLSARRPVLGSEKVSDYLFKGIEKDLGGHWAVESDPLKAAEIIHQHIEGKREALGINKEGERKLYDMEDRRALSVE